MQITPTWKQDKGKGEGPACLVKNSAKNDIQESWDIAQMFYNISTGWKWVDSLQVNVWL